MAITDKKTGVWGLDQVYNKKMQGGIWQLTHGSPLLFAWGRNNNGDNINGDLGLNDQAHRSSPTQIPGYWGSSPKFSAKGDFVTALGSI